MEVELAVTSVFLIPSPYRDRLNLIELIAQPSCAQHVA
jgi:hypothetical protein